MKSSIPKTKLHLRNIYWLVKCLLLSLTLNSKQAISVSFLLLWQTIWSKWCKRRKDWLKGLIVAEVLVQSLLDPWLWICGSTVRQGREQLVEEVCSLHDCWEVEHKEEATFKPLQKHVSNELDKSMSLSNQTSPIKVLPSPENVAGWWLSLSYTGIWGHLRYKW